MKNPIEFFNESIKNIKSIRNDISLKQKEINILKEQLNDIKYEKKLTKFKWYDVKNKANFNDDIKTKKKLLNDQITNSEKELNDLEKRKTAITDKIKQLILLIGIVVFVIVIVTAITIGSINEKKNPHPEITTEFIESTNDIENIELTTELITETTTETKTISTTETTTEKTTKETNKIPETERKTSRSQKIVYGSRTGNHYHIGGCRYANGAKMTIADAERKGWNPCAVCNP